MSDDKRSIDVSIGLGWIAFTVLVIMFVGDPDMHDAIMDLLWRMAQQ